VTRLSSTIRLDSRLQARHKVYLIVAIAVLGMALALRAVFSPDQLHFFMPVLVMSGVNVTTVFLVGVLLLIERSQGTLSVVMVSPLRPSEYLASKVLTLTALALAEGFVLAGVAYGLGFNFGWLGLAVVMRAAMGIAVGVAVGVRYRSITRFLFPGILAALAFDLPAIWYLELWTSDIFYAWPSTPPMILAKAAFRPIGPGELAYALGYGTLGVGAALIWARRSIDRFVVRGDLAS